MIRILLVLALATPALAASITSISPAVGTTGGDDVITITVDTSLFQYQVCSPPMYFAEVKFGGMPARHVTAATK